MSNWKNEESKPFFQCSISRRKFIQALVASGALAALPGGLLSSMESDPAIALGYLGKDAYETFYNGCPRNCYDTCSIKSYVKDGVLKFLEGAEQSTFTDGGLCVKGFSYPRTVYSPDRIKYPMIQEGRGSGNWKRVSWDVALDKIAKKILEIKQKDGNLLGLGLSKYSGNFGITHYGVEGMMTSLGYTTRFVGTPCWPAGIDAQNYDLGNMWCNDPEEMVKSKYIIIWGANPAYCSIHSMKYIYEAQRRGAKVVVIDPIFTQTAAKAHTYVQVKTSADAALALGMSKRLIDKDAIDRDWINANSIGFDEYEQYIRNEVTLEWAAKESGVPEKTIIQLADEFVSDKPSTIWIGYGLQRHINGGATVRAIDALVAMTGNVGIEGGGARYGHLYTWGFNYHALVQQRPKDAKGFTGKSGPMGEFHGPEGEKVEYVDRTVNINKTAQAILDTNDPPIRMLWAACKNIVSQDFDVNKLKKAFEKLEMVVAVDLFYNQTVEMADIVLPTTTPFEDWTVNVSYWHYWMTINEQAIKPLYESKSDIEIASALSEKLNKLEPGSCTFPEKIDPKEWMTKEFNENIYKLFGINSWEDLKKGPVKAKAPIAWGDKVFGTPSKKYEFKSELAQQHGHNALPKYVEPRKPTKPYRLLTPHDKHNIHSQFLNLDWMLEINPEPYVYINPVLAEKKNISDGTMTKVFNDIGEIKVKAKLTNNVPEDVVLMYEAWFGKKNNFNVNLLVDDTSSDMGKYKTGSPGVAIHDQFCDIEKA